MCRFSRVLYSRINYPTVYCPIQNHKAQSDEIEPVLTGAHFIVNFVFVMSPAEWQPIISSFPSEISVISTIYAFCKNLMGKNIEEPLACCRTIPPLYNLAADIRAKANVAILVH